MLLFLLLYPLFIEPFAPKIILQNQMYPQPVCFFRVSKQLKKLNSEEKSFFCAHTSPSKIIFLLYKKGKQRNKKKVCEYKEAYHKELQPLLEAHRLWIFSDHLLHHCFQSPRHSATSGISTQQLSIILFNVPVLLQLINTVQKCNQNKNMYIRIYMKNYIKPVMEQLCQTLAQ